MIRRPLKGVDFFGLLERFFVVRNQKAPAICFRIEQTGDTVQRQPLLAPDWPGPVWGDHKRIVVIITHVIGGLGNQIFQYAMGRALSLDKGVPLRLDLQDFEGYTLHNGFELGRVFNIDTATASGSDVRTVLGLRAIGPVRKRLFRSELVRFRGPNLFVDNLFGQRPQIAVASDNCYLMGNWQSEQFFKHIEGTLRGDLQFRSPVVGQNRELVARIQGVTAVSLHVRRGDMASNPAAMAIHGTCTLDYYRRAIGYVAARIAQPEFFVFSDDIPWVQENLQFEFPCHYIDHNKGMESYNDMRLMSLCRHHIIANSSFSWWGAWLNPRQDKIVVAPERWFASEVDSSGIVPATWLRI